MQRLHPRHHEPHVASLIDLFERLEAHHLDELAGRYADHARFKDPFNDVQGRAAVRRVYAHMFETLHAPRFKVIAVLGDDAECMLTWVFDTRLRGRPLRIRGATHLRFDATGRILDHRDYWDAAHELYARLPVIGGLFRWLRKRLAATPAD